MNNPYTSGQPNGLHCIVETVAPTTGPVVTGSFPCVAPMGFGSGAPLGSGAPPPPPIVSMDQPPTFPIVPLPVRDDGAVALATAKKHFQIKKKAMHRAYFGYRISNASAKIIAIIIAAIATLVIFLASADFWFSEPTRKSLAAAGTIIAGIATIVTTIAATLKLDARAQAFKVGTTYCGSIVDGLALGKYDNMSEDEIKEKIDQKNKKLGMLCEFPIPLYVLRSAERDYR